MSDHERGGRKARLFLFAILIGACSKHDLQYPTPWLRVDVVRPRADEMIRIGSREERYEVKSGDRWQRLGMSHQSGCTILGEEAITAPAAVVYLANPRSTLLVRPDAPPRRLEGAVYFPNRITVDVMKVNDREARIERYDAVSNQTTSFAVSIPRTYSDCRINTIKGYSLDGTPYVGAVCSPSSAQARCVVIAAGRQRVAYVVKPDQPQSDCDFPQLHLSQGSSAFLHFN